MSDFELVDQIIVVTGAAGGIGSEMCREFASAGATVVLAGRTEETLKSVAAELGDAQSLVVTTDVRVRRCAVAGGNHRRYGSRFSAEHDRHGGRRLRSGRCHCQ
jgi:NADP-dependent 3-hydroxy acid dehydrogenase YdfG